MDHVLGERVGAVIVNHNAGQALIDCVASLRRAGLESIIVVDNASDDASLEALAKADANAQIVASGTNLGYGKAINIGASRLHTEYLLVCNPDLTLESDAVEKLARSLAGDQEIGICGPQILNTDGSIYPSARSLPSLPVALAHTFLAPVMPENPFTRKYRRQDLSAEIERDADWVSGACFMVKMVTFESVGGFDERYFMYVEDLDLCWRAGRAGWRVHYLPEAKVTHLGAVSTGQHPYRMQLADHYSSWLFVSLD